MKKPVAADRFELGVCYYPEHWPEEMWEDDYRRMVETGFTIVRMGEFAWSIFEPEEGVYQFELFDRAIDLAYRHGLKVVLGTPTATPPAWLTERYPEVLNVTYEGVTLQHGMPSALQLQQPQIPRVMRPDCSSACSTLWQSPWSNRSWQIDNELNCEISEFYSESDHKSFRKWLQDKYGSLEKLNEAWGSVFWNQSYTNWSQVFYHALPRSQDSLIRIRRWTRSGLSLIIRFRLPRIRPTLSVQLRRINGLRRTGYSAIWTVIK